MNFYRLTQLMLLLISFLILPGCLTKNTQTASSVSSLTENSPLRTIAAQYETKALVTAEPPEILQEELAALDRLGIWEIQPTQATPEVNPTVVYDFPITRNKQVDVYLKLYQTKQRHYFKKLLERSGKYLPTIRRELLAAGLPTDLAYLAMIESGFNPTAVSPAKAVGLWQFMKGTARHHDLRVDRWVDERRNPDKSLTAAIAYLTRLHALFDDWYLAVAAYNAGEGKIGRGLKKYKAKDFWQLAKHRYLRLETKRYVPKLIASIMIAKDPKKYGFTDLNFAKPIQYEELTVPAHTPLVKLALAAGTNIETIKQLNNELRTLFTPPKPTNYTVRIPFGRKQVAATQLAQIQERITTDYKVHITRKNDTIGKICRLYHLNKTTLLKANKLRRGQLKTGQRLRIPYRTVRYQIAGQDKSIKAFTTTADSNKQLILHKVRPGETLSTIAARHGVRATTLANWNGLESLHKIKAGQQLALYLGSPSGLSKQTPFPTPLVVLRDHKKTKPTGRQTTIASNHYLVRQGDSIWTIARRFLISTQELRRWNKLSSNTIHAGQKLIIKKG